MESTQIRIMLFSVPLFADPEAEHITQLAGVIHVPDCFEPTTDLVIKCAQQGILCDVVVGQELLADISDDEVLALRDNAKRILQAIADNG